MGHNRRKHASTLMTGFSHAPGTAKHAARRGPAPCLISWAARTHAFQSLRVIGTNGKGSTCAMLEAGLIAAGLSTGCFTSPHLSRFEERVRIGGRELEPRLTAVSWPGRSVTRRTRLFLICRWGWPACEFARAGVQWAVMEAGVGGGSATPPRRSKKVRAVRSPTWRSTTRRRWDGTAWPRSPVTKPGGPAGRAAADHRRGGGLAVIGRWPRAGRSRSTPPRPIRSCSPCRTLPGSAGRTSTATRRWPWPPCGCWALTAGAGSGVGVPTIRPGWSASGGRQNDFARRRTQPARHRRARRRRAGVPTFCCSAIWPAKTPPPRWRRCWP